MIAPSGSIPSRIFNSICPRALHPQSFAVRRCRDRDGWRILSGPFRGMRYVGRSVGSAFQAKIIGTYEMELHGAIEELCRERFDVIIDVGAAEGYYAVGMALRCTSARVVAFESEAAGQNLIRELARLNSVSDRVEVSGHCAPADLKAAIARSTRPPLVIMDAEGAELELLDPKRISMLRSSSILVELHDCLREGISDAIRERFTDTHAIRCFTQRQRSLSDLPVRSLLLDRWLIRMTNEHRPAPMSWFVMRPRKPGAPEN
ncbi:MAG: hypothetical protein ACREJC_02705 [Tepidisphaeraceae bacterium]